MFLKMAILAENKIMNRCEQTYCPKRDIFCKSEDNDQRMEYSALVAQAC